MTKRRKSMAQERLELQRWRLRYRRGLTHLEPPQASRPGKGGIVRSWLHVEEDDGSIWCRYRTRAYGKDRKEMAAWMQCRKCKRSILGAITRAAYDRSVAWRRKQWEEVLNP